MTTTRRLTTIMGREGDGTVGWCPALDIANQGDTVESARANVQEAISLVLEVAPPEDVTARLKGDVFVTDVKVAFGTADRAVRPRRAAHP